MDDHVTRHRVWRERAYLDPDAARWSVGFHLNEREAKRFCQFLRCRARRRRSIFEDPDVGTETMPQQHISVGAAEILDEIVNALRSLAGGQAFFCGHECPAVMCQKRSRGHKHVVPAWAEFARVLVAHSLVQM